jgi:hypothetical protein
MQKPIVHYTPTAFDSIVYGFYAYVEPVDHTSPYVSNTRAVTTSRVIRVENNGVFETMNSIYIPVGIEYKGE